MSSSSKNSSLSKQTRREQDKWTLLFLHHFRHLLLIVVTIVRILLIVISIHIQVGVGLLHIQVVHHKLILSVLVLIAVCRRKLPLTPLLLPHIDALLNRSCLLHLLHVLVLERNDLGTRLGTGVSLQQLLFVKGVCDTDIIQGDELTTPLERLHDGQRVLLESHNVQCGRDGFCAGELGGLAVIHGVGSDQEG